MTRPDRDYDEILSRVLHSTLDPIEPAGDGLAKIQKRIAEPWLKRRMSLLRTELTALGWLIAVRCGPFFSALRSGLAGLVRPGGRWMWSPLARGAAAVATGSGRHRGPSRDRPADAAARRWVGPTMAWLRPTLAVAGAVVIVVAGVFAMHGFNLAFSPAANTGTANSGRHSSHTGHGVRGPGAGTAQSQQATTPGPGTSSSTQTSSTGSITGSSTPAPSPRTSQPSPSPSPTGTSPTPTPTPTTPGPTGTPGPTESATAPSGGTASATTSAPG